MKTFTIFWLSGSTQLITGDTLVDAINNAKLTGSMSEIGKVYKYEEGDARYKYEWDFKTNNWKQK